MINISLFNIFQKDNILATYLNIIKSTNGQEHIELKVHIVNHAEVRISLKLSVSIAGKTKNISMQVVCYFHMDIVHKSERCTYSQCRERRIRLVV